MTKLPSWRLPWNVIKWAYGKRVPWLSLVVLIVALSYAIAGGFAVGRIILLLLSAVFAGLRYLRLVRGSLKEARESAAEAARTRKPIPRYEVPLRVSDSLLDDEKVIVQTRLHPIVVIQWWLVAAFVPVFLVAGSSLMGHFLIQLAVGVVILTYAVFNIVDWWRSRLYVTDSRILFLHGVFAMSLAETPIKKVTDKETEERLFAVLLARLRIIRLPYGRLGIETAGQKQWIEMLKSIPNVMMVGSIISQYASGSG